MGEPFMSDRWIAAKYMEAKRWMGDGRAMSAGLEGG